MAKKKKIKVLIVDDSAFVRKALKRMLSADPYILVIGQAADGYEAIKEIKLSKPDVITLDVKMPGLDGLKVLDWIMKATIVSYKRGRHLIHPRHVIVKVPGIEEKSKAQQLVGKKVSYNTKSGKVMKGVISRPHGNNGLIRVRFTKGMPGQAIGDELVISEAVEAPKPKKEKKK